MKLVFTLFLLFTLIYQANNQNLNLDLSTIFGNIIDPNFIANILRPIIPVNLPPLFNVSLPKSQCRNQLNRLRIGLHQGERWALKMIDASAKPQSGILAGNVMHMGNYDECLKINENLEDVEIQGQYCTAMFRPHEKFGNALEKWLSENLFANTSNKVDSAYFISDLRKSVGFCVPAVCSPEELQELAVELEESIQSPLHFIFDQTFCDTAEAEPFSTAAILAIVIFSGFAIIVLFSTLYDVLIYQKLNGNGFKEYTVFSLYSNSVKLFSTKSSGDSLQCLNGIRVISMLWIIIGHRFMYNFWLPHNNAFDIEEWKDKIENSVILGSIMAVESFFTVSGLLVVYVVLIHKDKTEKFSLPMFYLHRIFRLTPPLAMVILFHATLMKYIGNGPFWPVIYEIFQKPCETNWWSTLIFLQNYIHPRAQCVGQTWFLAVDTQLHFLAPLFLLPLMRWPKSTIVTMLITTAICCGYVFEVSWKKNLGSIFFDQDGDQFVYFYSPTHARISAYLIGGICGYFIYTTRNKPIRLCKMWATTLWIFSLLIMLGTVLGFSAFVHPDYSPVDSGIFNALSRPGWALGLSIVIILCVNGYGGVINSFLSYPIFTVLIRLNYSIYLLHLVVVVFFVGQQREPNSFSNMVGFHQIWGDFILTIFVAVLWTLAFESPTFAIEKMLFGKTQRKVDFNTNGKTVEAIVVNMVENGHTDINIDHRQ